MVLPHHVNRVRNENLLKTRVKGFTRADDIKKAGLYPYFRVIESEQDTVVNIAGKKVIMFGSNSYLGLTNHPVIKKASIDAINKYGCGCAGSRFLNGTLDIHIELEEKLAAYVGKESALIFSTGFQVNLGVIPALLGRHDFLILDELDHASIIEASRLCFCKVLKYKHNDLCSLEKVLQSCDSSKIKLIVTEGIFSMDGDIANLPGISALAEQYHASLMVDDAHSLGVLGNLGSGVSAHFNLTDKTDLIMGTFSKSLASIGGFIAADKSTINYLQHHARSLMFSASISPAATGSVLGALKVIHNEPERIDRLWENTQYAMHLFNQLGFDTGHTQSPIIPIYVRDDLKTFKLSKMLMDSGIFVNPVAAPAVAKEDSLIRFSLMATHTKEQINIAAEKIYQIAQKLSII